MATDARTDNCAMCHKETPGYLPRKNGWLPVERLPPGWYMRVEFDTVGDGGKPPILVCSYECGMNYDAARLEAG